MSRSLYHAPVVPWKRSVSDKWDKRQANKAARRITKALLRTAIDDTPVLPTLREVSDSRGFAKDGSHCLWGRMPQWPWTGEVYQKKWYSK